MELSKKLHQGYRLFIVSFYTTQHLATNMLQLRTFLIEALKFTNSSMSSCLKDIKLSEKVSAQGVFRCYREGAFVYVQWRDSTTVTIISLIHRFWDRTMCKNCKWAIRYKKKMFVKPMVIQDYNSKRGGVDKSKQMLKRISMLFTINFSLVESSLFSQCRDSGCIFIYHFAGICKT